MTAPITVTALRDDGQIHEHAAAWRALLNDSPSCCPFLSPDWLGAWWGIYGQDRELLVLLAERAGELVGLAPLYIDTARTLGGVPLRELRLLGDRDVGSDFLDIILRKDSGEDALAAMLDYLRQNETWDRMILCDVPAASETLRLLGDAAKRHLPLWQTAPAQTCPFLPMPASFDEFLDLPDLTYKHAIRKAVRKLEKRRAVEFELTSAPSDQDERLESFFRLHQERWQAVQRAGSFARDEKRQFYRSASAALGRQGWLRLSTLKVDGQPVASAFGICHANVYYGLQTACGLEGQKLKAGNVLAYKLFETLFGEVKEWNFMRGNELYKYQWGCTDRYTVHASACRSFKGALVAIAQTGAAATKTLAKRMRDRIFPKRA
jgi:CelD/BcsL family acetyltransferase involved in cellulose biosynthesis